MITGKAKKELKLPRWAYPILICGVVVGASAVSLYSVGGGPNDGRDVVVKDGVVTYVDKVESTPAVSAPSRVMSGANSNVLAPRMVAAPSYDTVVMAARIIQEAADQDQAAIFVSLQQTRRNARLQKEIAELNAQIKEAEAKFYESDARVVAAKSGKPLAVNEPFMAPPTNASERPEETDSAELNSKARLRLVTLSQREGKGAEMTIQIGERWYTPVQTGQTVEGFVVGTVDDVLKCVTLTKDPETHVVCLN